MMAEPGNCEKFSKLMTVGDGGPIGRGHGGPGLPGSHM